MTATIPPGAAVEAVAGEPALIPKGEGAEGAGSPRPAASTAVVTATRDATDDLIAGAVSFAVSDPPTAEDLRRWHGLAAASPALAGATWTAGPGSDVRR